MSWSFSQTARKDKAREAFAKAHREQPVYKADKAHKNVMDKIAAFAAEVAEAAPDGIECSISSSGHVSADGTGLASILLTFFKSESVTKR